MGIKWIANREGDPKPASWELVLVYISPQKSRRGFPYAFGAYNTDKGVWEVGGIPTPVRAWARPEPPPWAL